MISRITGLILRPAATFAEIVREPHFLAPWLLASLLFAAPMIAAIHRIGAPRLFGSATAILQTQPDLSEQSPEAVAEAMALLFQFVIVLTPIVGIPLTAVCVIPMVRAMHGRAGFRPLLAVTAWATLLPAMGMCLTAAVVLLLRDPAKLSLDSFAPLNLGVLIPARVSPLLHNLGSTLEFFSAWSVYLLSEGIAAAAGIGVRRVFLALALPLLVLAWLIAAAAAML